MFTQAVSFHRARAYINTVNCVVCFHFKVRRLVPISSSNTNCLIVIILIQKCLQICTNIIFQIIKSGLVEKRNNLKANLLRWPTCPPS